MKKFIKEWGPYLLIAVIVILVRVFIITPVRVDGSSMDKTLKDGQILMLYKLDNISFEDIVVIDKTVEGDNIIKRVIGMPKDTIKCEDGIIYINNKEYKDSHAYGITSDFEEIKLKKDEYFVLGDNRLVSFDSRYFGPVKKSAIKGTTKLRIFPFTKLGMIK